GRARLQRSGWARANRSARGNYPTANPYYTACDPHVVIRVSMRLDSGKKKEGLVNIEIPPAKLSAKSFVNSCKSLRINAIVNAGAPATPAESNRIAHLSQILSTPPDASASVAAE